MQTYIVGGAVRDELLGLPVKDRDFVVVGATPEEMLAQGFKPVGKDFPVFLHPQTHEEYALARTERKTAPGYTGFAFHAAPDVTLEQDLIRRDLTINAIAKNIQGGLQDHFIDPYGGIQDLRNRILRHVSPEFAEDPVRILRVARFSARFDGFVIADETLALMQSMVTNGEVDHLVAERVWQELACGLMEAKPSRMFEVLRACGALAKILPDIVFEGDTGAHLMRVVDCAASQHYSLAVRFATLFAERRVESVTALCKRLRVPAECRDLALLVACHYGKVYLAEREMNPVMIVRLLERCDALRRPQRFEQFLQTCACYADRPYIASSSLFLRALEAVRSVDAADVVSKVVDKAKIPEWLRAARVSALETMLQGKV